MRQLSLLFFLAALVGLVFSPPLLSIGLIGMMIVSAIREPEVLGRRFRHPYYWAFAALYLVMMVSVWQTEDWGYLLERLRIKIPLLLLPLSWPNSKTDVALFRRVVVIFSATALAGVLINYALDYAAINELLKQGRAVPVPRGNHIRFSLLVALAALLTYGNYREGGRKIWLFTGIFLFLGLHLLAVRSGLLGAYAGAGVLALGRAFSGGNRRWALLSLLGLALLPVVAYLTVPTFRNKLNYARYELLHRNPEEDKNGYSDNIRFRSIAEGLAVWREAPLFGIGYGNLQLRMPEHRPHNQFVSALASGGLLGFLITLGAFLYLGFGRRRWREPVYLAVWGVLFLSCLFENTLESSVGVSLFVLSLLLSFQETSSG